jgi:protein KRI1
VTADVDAAILTTLAKIRRKDESIYQAGKRVFDGE